MEGVRFMAMNARFLRSVCVLCTGLLGVTLVGPSPSATGQQISHSLPSADPTEVGLSKERLARLDGMLQTMVDERELAGVVTLLARHGKVAFIDVAGVQDIESNRPMTRDSIFRIFSMTKPITGVAMMMLYEEGHWRLNDPVSRYIPEFETLRVYAGENSNGSMQEEELDHPITMRELMTHTAGLSYTLDMRHATFGQSHVSRAACAEFEGTIASHDRQNGNVATLGTAWNALDLQLVGRCTRLFSREAIRSKICRLSQGAYF